MKLMSVFSEEFLWNGLNKPFFQRLKLWTMDGRGNATERCLLWTLWDKLLQVLCCCLLHTCCFTMRGLFDFSHYVCVSEASILPQTPQIFEFENKKQWNNFVPRFLKVFYYWHLKLWALHVQVFNKCYRSCWVSMNIRQQRRELYLSLELWFLISLFQLWETFWRRGRCLLLTSFDICN